MNQSRWNYIATNISLDMIFLTLKTDSLLQQSLYEQCNLRGQVQR